MDKEEASMKHDMTRLTDGRTAQLVRKLDLHVGLSWGSIIVYCSSEHYNNNETVVLASLDENGNHYSILRDGTHEYYRYSQIYKLGTGDDLVYAAIFKTVNRRNYDIGFLTSPTDLMTMHSIKRISMWPDRVLEVRL